MQLPKLQLQTLLNDIHQSVDSGLLDETKTQIDHLRALGRNVDVINSFDRETFISLCLLTSKLLPPSKPLGQMEYYVTCQTSIFATISNVLLINRYIHRNFTGCDYLMKNLIDTSEFISFNYLPNTNDKFKKLVPELRCMFLVLYNGIKLSDTVAQDYSNYLQLSLRRINDFIVNYAADQPMHEIDADGLFISKEVWKTTYTFLHNYNTHTEAFVPSLPGIVDCFNVLMRLKDKDWNMYSVARSCAHVFLCFDVSAHLRLALIKEEMYLDLSANLLKLLHAELSHFAQSKKTNEDLDDLVGTLSSIDLIIHMTDEKKVSTPKIQEVSPSASVSQLEVELRKTSISSGEISSEVDSTLERVSYVSSSSSIGPNLDSKDHVKFAGEVRQGVCDIFLNKLIPVEKPDGITCPTLYTKLMDFVSEPLNSKAKDSILDIFFKLSQLSSDSDVSCMVLFLKLVGYLNSTGYIFNNHLIVPNDVDVDAYMVSHYYKPQSGSRKSSAENEMTEEEKEQEAEKLFVLLERIKKNGVLSVQNPVETWQREGKFEGN